MTERLCLPATAKPPDAPQPAILMLVQQILLAAVFELVLGFRCRV